MDSTTHLTIHTDGGARSNPGPAGIGVVIEEKGTVIHTIKKYIGETTNNVAEYTAVIEALTWVKNQKTHPALIDFFLDSQLVVRQLKGLYKIKDARLRELSLRIRILESEVHASVRYSEIPREQNSAADALVNAAVDIALAR